MDTNLARVAAERIAKARAELILARTFYGVLVSQVTPVASDQFPTMATNGKQHFYSPAFIATLSPEELLAVIAHEIEHDARRHHTRRGGRDPVKWNEAADYVINPDLVDEGFKLPKGVLLDPRFKGMSAEDVYRTLEIERELEKQDKPEPDEDEGEPELPDESDEDEAQAETEAFATDGSDEFEAEQAKGQGEGGDEAGDEAGDDENGDAPGDGQSEAEDAGKPGEGEAGDGEGDTEGEGPGQGTGDADGEADGEPGQGPAQKSSGDPGRMGEVLDAAEDVATLADEDAKWERVVRQAAMLAAKRGDAPGHVAREIERADHLPQNWRETLRAYFDGGATTSETWNRPNRRLIGSGIYLPGRQRDGINRVVFMVDTSGSMDKIALEAIRVEAEAALDENVIQELVVLYGDTRVTRVDTFNTGDELTFSPEGGGGTVLAPLFDYVRNNVDSPTLCVVFTDGYIDDVAAHGEPPCEVLWAFTGYPQVVKQMIASAPWGAPAIDVGAH